MTLTEAVAIRTRQLCGEAVDPDTMAIVLETIRRQGAVMQPRRPNAARKVPARPKGGA